MQVVNIRTARSIWLFDTGDLNPKGLNPLPFFMALKDRYHFLVWPKTPEDLSWTRSATTPKGVKFLDGSFSAGDQPLAVGLSVFNDGIIADTSSSTDHSDSFLRDVIAFAAQHFGSTFDQASINQKIYLSEMIVRADSTLAVASPKLSKLAARMADISGLGASAEFSGFELRVHPRDAQQPFKFERDAAAFSAPNRYYSSAPMRTEDHKKLLMEFEAIMAGDA